LEPNTSVQVTIQAVKAKPAKKKSFLEVIELLMVADCATINVDAPPDWSEKVD